MKADDLLGVLLDLNLHSVEADAVGLILLLTHLLGLLLELGLQSLPALGSGPLPTTLIKMTEQLALVASVVKALALLSLALLGSPTEPTPLGLGLGRAVLQKVARLVTLKASHPWVDPSGCLVDRADCCR